MTVRELKNILDDCCPDLDIKLHYDGAIRSNIEVVYVNRDLTYSDNKMPQIVLGCLCGYDEKELKNNPKVEIIGMKPDPD